MIFAHSSLLVAAASGVVDSDSAAGVIG